MPLRVWRTDEVTPLSPHRNDPGPGQDLQEIGAEFLTTFTAVIPAGTPGQAVAGTEAREAERAQELAGQGRLVRLWALPGQGRTLGLWRARNAAEMQAILESLPLYAWMIVQTTPLTQHPNDRRSPAAEENAMTGRTSGWRSSPEALRASVPARSPGTAGGAGRW